MPFVVCWGEDRVRMESDMSAALIFAVALMCGCGGGMNAGSQGPPPEQKAAIPTLTTETAQNGASVVSLSDNTSGATIYYTLDGSAPTSTSMQYFAPFLVSSNLTVKAVAVAPGFLASEVVSKNFTPNIASGTLVWSDEFANSAGAKGWTAGAVAGTT